MLRRFFICVLVLPTGCSNLTLNYSSSEWYDGVCKPSPNNRNFDVILEEGELGQVVVPNIDIWAEVGKLAALKRTAMNVEVEDGALDISFKKIKENPKVSARVHSCI